MESFKQQIDTVSERNTSETEGYLAELEKKVATLTEANTQMNELISIAAHQLRGPLAGIRGYTSLILEGDYGVVPESITEPLKIISNSAESLTHTVDDFLDVSRIEQGAMRYYRKDFDLASLVNEVLAETQIAIKNAGLELKLDIATEPAVIHGDRTKLKHILLNLIDNAIKYTKSGWIEISFKKTSNQILFSVKDSGVGIKPETLPKLFGKFSRCAEADKTNNSGLGLGLYVAQAIAKAHNGRIWVESAGEGKGSQFYVELPCV